MSSKTTSILNDILLLLEPIVKSDAEGIRELAGEARMVLTARLAFQNAQPGGKADQTSPEEDSRTTYQHALKLLQDPILPVRAHGLLLLRQLVTSSSQGSKPLDPALVPAIQDIFMQSVQDNDSYIFLNAVQGLAALVDRFGASVLKHMVQNYTRGLTEMHGGDMTQQEVDIRLRVGEALAAVVETSRSSDTEAVMDDQPTSKNTKFPPLRRAALHFLSLLLKGTTEQIYDSSFGKEVFSKELIQRAKIILSYVSDTDVDTVVKVMGREALEQLAQLERAMIDL
ncbi:hypothetical protein WG66_005171 [Moniliophthora roreri]|nr:hypothetical protein WG66_005171 [Moniliophthora roreri]